jgi:hypothetical protein
VIGLLRRPSLGEWLLLPALFALGLALYWVL